MGVLSPWPSNPPPPPPPPHPPPPLLQRTSVFEEEEHAQLRTVLGLDDSGLYLVLEGCSYVLEQAAYSGASDALLAEELAEAGVSLTQVRRGGQGLWRRVKEDVGAGGGGAENTDACLFSDKGGAWLGLDAVLRSRRSKQCGWRRAVPWC